ncbi:peptidoglycan bridge formation glycyltransferase FemA/FemB family protein [Patescibacteria group bacterium]|nr:peptidoglycan bridge formation glycyltransferase FemA/FemB family protein [Patescibacteria group bacterium]
MDKEQWNNLVTRHSPIFGAFLHSWEWGEFQKSVSRDIERVFVENDSGVCVAQAIKMDLPAGQFYWFVPKGPIGTMSSEESIKVIRESLDGGMFLRIEPGEAGRMLRVKDVQPSATIAIDLSKPKDEIWDRMKPKTRYNIRLGERKGVECKFVGLEYFDDFIRLMEQTSTRDQFKAHSHLYYKAMLETMSQGDCTCRLAVALYDSHVIAVNIIVDFAGTRTYLHGATSNLHRNVMAQYALHGFLIEDAKNKEFRLFDFWGVAPAGSAEDHPWQGITKYKNGFGGDFLEMPGTYDIPMKQMWYAVYRISKKFI